VGIVGPRRIEQHHRPRWSGGILHGQFIELLDFPAERVRFLAGDLFGPLEEMDLRMGIDIIVTNPPYIRSDELPTLQPEVRDFEPEMALIAGAVGTEIAERIIITAHNYLRSGGSLIMEMGMGQTDAIRKIIADTNRYRKPEVLKDLAGIERVITAEKI